MMDNSGLCSACENRGLLAHTLLPVILDLQLSFLVRPLTPRNNRVVSVWQISDVNELES